MDLVCRALWLNQVLHLVQSHQVYDQVMYIMTATSELVTPSTRHTRVSSHSELVTSEHRTKQSIIITGGLQPVATCRQSPYIHKPAIIIMASSQLIMTSFASLAAPVLIWRHSLLSWPRPALRTYVVDTLPPLIYKDVYLLTFQRLIGYIYHLISCQ